MLVNSVTEPCLIDSTDAHRRSVYVQVHQSIQALLEHETDVVSAMASTAAILHHAFAYFSWTGFYRRVSPTLLKVGPYQGTLGCTDIPIHKGVCGAAIRTQSIQNVPNVHLRADHIACAASTQSEIVLPVFKQDGTPVAVLDVDSNALNAFGKEDEVGLQRVCKLFSSPQLLW